MPLQLHGWREHVSLWVGAAICATIGPLLARSSARRSFGRRSIAASRAGLVESGRELSGLIFGRLLPWFDRLTAPLNRRFVKHAEDAFIVNAAIYFGLGLPLSLSPSRMHVAATSTAQVLALCFAYHVLRIGPFFMNFATCTSSATRREPALTLGAASLFMAARPALTLCATCSTGGWGCITA